MCQYRTAGTRVGIVVSYIILNKIPTRISSDEEEELVDCSSGVIETNVGGARYSFVGDVVRNGKDSERAKQQANDNRGKCFPPPPLPSRTFTINTAESVQYECHRSKQRECFGLEI